MPWKYEILDGGWTFKKSSMNLDLMGEFRDEGTIRNEIRADEINAALLILGSNLEVNDIFRDHLISQWASTPVRAELAFEGLGRSFGWCGARGTCEPSNQNPRLFQRSHPLKIIFNSSNLA